MPSGRVIITDPQATVTVRDEVVQVITVGVPGPAGPPSTDVGAVVTTVGGRFRHKQGDALATWDTAPTLNVRDFYIAADGADWLLAFNRASAAAKAAGGATIQIPPGTYPWSSSTTSGGMVWQWAIEGDNIRVVWEQGAVVQSTVTNARALVVIGGAKPAGMANWATTRHKDPTGYNLTGTQTKGRNTIALATVGDAGNFAAGDLIYIHTGQITAGFADDQPDSETNEVNAVDAVAGTITLRWSLVKSYAQEYYITGTTGLTSTSVTANAAPYKVHKVTDRTLRNIELINPTFECPTGVLQVISIWQAVGLRIRGGNILTPRNGIGSRDTRYVKINGTDLERRDNGLLGYAISESTGCSNWEVTGVGAKSDGFWYFEMTEGPARSRWHHNTIECANQATLVLGSLFQVGGARGRAHDIDIDHNDYIVNFPTEANAIHLGDNPSAGPSSGSFTHNRIIAANAAAHIRVDSGDWLVYGNEVSNGRIGLRGPQFGKGHLAPIDPVAGWVFGTAANQQLTPELGVLLRDQIVIRVHVRVRTVFNSDGTDTLTIGHDADTDAYATSIDVSTTGIKTVTLGTAALTQDESVSRTIKAYYVAGGSAPTTGEAQIIVERLLLPRRT